MPELSKGQVNRAGEYLSDWWKTPPADGAELEPAFFEHVNVVLEWRDQHSYPLSLTMPGLRNWVENAGGPTRPAQRLKQLQTIVEKCARHPGMKLARMQDIAGCRAVLSDDAQIDEVAQRIRDHWDVDRCVDYRSQGRSDTGYRGLHLMVVKRERIVEIQLRSSSQHDWAEVVAATGSRLGYPLKDGIGPPELVQYFKMASNLLRLQELGQAADEGLTEIFQKLREEVRPYFADR
jgi:ppGpp synthetase/RelA/SpoT-type nucleotidyltranferase